jgi:peptidoglycan/xylan/chitin deacetylase (PgdA/CDA1 family)
VALVALVSAVVAGSADPSLQLFGPAILRGAGSRPEVALTFDDGPDPASTEALLDALDTAGASATFFVLVDRAQAHPELLRRIATTHEIGLHGLHHDPWLTLRPPSAGAAELREAMGHLEALTGKRPRWYRPPFGATSPRMMASVAQAGLQMVWCSVRTRDGVAIAPDKLVARASKAVAGDIVLLHEGLRPCRDVLPQILDDLARRGLKAVSVQELLAR